MKRTLTFRKMLLVVPALLGLSMAGGMARGGEKDCPPKKATGRWTGGGNFFCTDGQGNEFKVTHGFELHCSTDLVPNNLEVNWLGGENFHLTELLTAECHDLPEINPRPPRAPVDQLIATGTGRFNNEDGATISFEMTDAGEPGRNDVMTLTITSPGGEVVLDCSNTLNGGNHQAHRLTGRDAR